MTSAPLSARRILVICLARVFLFATFMTVAATLPLIMADWGISATAAGAIISSFTIGYALSLFLFAWAADYFGAKRMVVVSALAAATASLLFGLFAADLYSALVLYGLVGLTQGGVYTPLIMVLSDEVQSQRRGQVMGQLIASTSLGYTVSLLAAGLGIALGGWSAAFWLSGLLPILGALILITALHPVANRIHPRPSPRSSPSNQLLPSPQRRENRLLIGGYIAHSWELLGMWAWVPAFLAAALALHGMEAAGATVSGAYISGVLHLFGAIAALTMGRLSDHSGRRPVLIAVAAAGALLSFSIGWLIHAPLILLLPLVLAYTFVCIGDSPVLTTALSETVPPGQFGTVLAWRSLAGFGAGAVAPLGVGWVLDMAQVAHAPPAVSWGLGFAALGLGGAIALLCALALPRRPRR